MRKQAIHVKSYQRSRHGRASYGGNVCAHNKSGREAGNLFRIQRLDPLTQQWAETQGTEFTSQEAAETQMKRTEEYLLSTEGYPGEYYEKHYGHLPRRQYRVVEGAKLPEPPPAPPAQKSLMAWSGRARSYDPYHAELNKFISDYKVRWGSPPSQKEIIWKRLNLEKAGYGPEQKQLVPVNVVTPFRENIFPGGTKPGEGRRSRKPARSYYRRRISRGD